MKQYKYKKYNFVFDEGIKDKLNIIRKLNNQKTLSKTINEMIRKEYVKLLQELKEK